MSTTGPHPSSEVLAEYVEGSLTDDTTAVAAHVERCSDCQDVMEQLNAVRVALRDLPAEQPVPEHVSARLSAAISAEAAGRGESSGASVPGGDADPGTVAWFRRRAPRALALAASVAVVGLAGYVAVTSDDGGGDMTSAGSSGQAGESSELESGPKQHNQAQDESEVLDDDSAEPDSAGSGAAAPAPADLRSAVNDVWENDAELAPECGAALAAELGLSLVGSTDSGPGVLVVLEDEAAGQLHGHLVPTCGSTTTEELSVPVTLPRP
ncbi:hypothetical protein [Haloactinopolyspora sp.]|uniref:anti-sigma factor family protein n=1 Tax=Haloactinopolyspora sp. TaxID=1966353 RepID=UPI002630D87C|nr:hypothetical protein [Haloactinopolyspora sp.]